MEGVKSVFFWGPPKYIPGLENFMLLILTVHPAHLHIINILFNMIFSMPHSAIMMNSERCTWIESTRYFEAKQLELREGNPRKSAGILS